VHTNNSWTFSVLSSNKQIVITFLLLCFSVLFFALTNADIFMQDIFFNAHTHTWLVNKTAQPYEFLFYSGIKKFLIIFAVTLLFILIIFWKNKKLKAYKKGLFIVIFSAIFVPVVTGGLKKYTNMPCPKHLIHYGGEYPHTAVWERYETPYDKLDSIRCWPAGHASGGFALMSLFFLFKRKRNKTLALAFSLAIGWSMGMYKMLIGDHFFSHTLITMLLAWIIILLVEKAVAAFTLSDEAPPLHP